MKHLASYLLLLSLVQPAVLRAGDLAYQGLPAGSVQIKQDRQGHVYIAVLGTAGVVVRTDEDRPSVWKRGPIGSLEVTPGGEVWLVESGRIVRCDDEEASIDRTDSFRPENAPGELFASRSGALWSTGCLAMRGHDGLFVPARLNQNTGWRIAPRCEDPFGNVWAIASGKVGSRRDLAVRTAARPYDWRRFDLPSLWSERDCVGVCADDVGFVWLATGEALLRVDPRREGDQWRTIDRPGTAPISAIARIANGQIAVGFTDGTIRELSVYGDHAPQWREVAMVSPGPVRAMLHDRRGDLWIAGGGDLYRSAALRLPWQQHWEEQPRMPAGDHDVIFARAGKKLYTAGGKTFFGMPASEWVNLDHLWSYDLERGTWAVEPPMLEPGKAYSGIAALGGEIWLVGGNFRAGTGTRPTASVEIYNPGTRRYRWGPPLDQPRDQVVALTVDDRLFAVGGAGGGGAVAAVYSIAAGESRWRTEPPAPAPILQASGCVLDGKLYIAAGSSSHCPGLFVYDPKRRDWGEIRHPSDDPPNAPLCAAFDGQVWVLGGWGRDGGRTETYAYSPVVGRWKRGPDLPLPLSWAAAAEVNHRLLIAGGAYRYPHEDQYFNSDRVFLLRRP